MTRGKGRKEVVDSTRKGKREKNDERKRIGEKVRCKSDEVPVCLPDAG
jgi:hypothetical protein